MLKLKRTRTTGIKVREFFRNRLLDTRALFRRRIEEQQFKEIVGLFIVSITHESGGMLTDSGYALEKLLGEKKVDLDLANLLQSRLSTLGSILSGIPVYRTCLDDFQKKELRCLNPVERGLGDKDRSQLIFYTINSRQARKIVLKDARKFRVRINELKAIYEALGVEGINQVAHRPIVQQELNRLLLNIELVTGTLDLVETLCLDNFDFSSRTVALRIVGKDGWRTHKDLIYGFIPRAIQYQSIPTPQLKSDWHPLDGLKAMVDPFFYMLIVKNILSNAKRAAEERGIKLQVELFARVEAGKVILEFKDNGNGMAQEIMDKLNSGIQVTTKTDEGPHGLGFDYCRKLAEKMGGKLYVKESTIGIGSTVALELPLAEKTE